MCLVGRTDPSADKVLSHFWPLYHQKQQYEGVGLLVFVFLCFFPWPQPADWPVTTLYVSLPQLWDMRRVQTQQFSSFDSSEGICLCCSLPKTFNILWKDFSWWMASRARSSRWFLMEVLQHSRKDFLQMSCHHFSFSSDKKPQGPHS